MAAAATQNAQAPRQDDPRWVIGLLRSVEFLPYLGLPVYIVLTVYYAPRMWRWLRGLQVGRLVTLTVIATLAVPLLLISGALWYSR